MKNYTDRLHGEGASGIMELQKSNKGGGSIMVIRAIPEKNAKEKMAIRRDTACRVRRSIWINNILSEIHPKSDVLFTK